MPTNIAVLLQEITTPLPDERLKGWRKPSQFML